MVDLEEARVGVKRMKKLSRRSLSDKGALVIPPTVSAQTKLTVGGGRLLSETAAVSTEAQLY